MCIRDRSYLRGRSERPCRSILPPCRPRPRICPGRGREVSHATRPAHIGPALALDLGPAPEPPAHEPRTVAGSGPAIGPRGQVHVMEAMLQARSSGITEAVIPAKREERLHRLMLAVLLYWAAAIYIDAYHHA